MAEALGEEISTTDSSSIDLRLSLISPMDAPHALLGVTASTLHSAVLQCDVRAVRAVIASSLRYCPECLDGGFHATIHQCTFLVHCPIHRSRLRARCPQCKEPIVYRWESSTIPAPFSCPACGHLLASSLAEPRGRPRGIARRQSYYLCRLQGTIERHLQAQALSPRGGSTPTSGGASQSRHGRLAFIDALAHEELLAGFVPEERLRATHHWAASLIATAQVTNLRSPPPFPTSAWPAFGGVFLTLESQYRCVLQLLNFATSAPRHHTFPSKSRRSRSLATLLFRMTWEGTHDPSYLDQHNHPSFGIALWLSLVEMRHIERDRPDSAIQAGFAEAMQRTLVAALHWSWAIAEAPDSVETPYLLIPEIVDFVRSQNFRNRNLQMIDLAA